MAAVPRKVALIFGTRPEAIKLFPVLRELRKYPRYFRPIVIVTGQHKEMLRQMLKLFGIRPAHDLRVMSEGQSLGELSYKMIVRLEKLLEKVRPDCILVQGDTTTTFLASLVAFYLKIPVGHIEAGLRTGDPHNPFPEEVNRLLTTQLASWHFAPTEKARREIERTVTNGAKIYCTGNTVIDTLKMMVTANGQIKKTDRPFVLITAHRRESFGRPLENICRAIRELARTYPQLDFVFPVHLNPHVQSTVRKLLSGWSNIKLLKPLAYAGFVRKLSEALLVLTDSGGIQEEAPALGVPVLVLRDKTERPEAIACGAVKLVGTEYKAVISAVQKVLSNKALYKKMAQAVSPYGDGKAAERIVQALLVHFGYSRKIPRSFFPGRSKIVTSLKAHPAFGVPFPAIGRDTRSVTRKRI
jgi:UDP-N-acetylglucosamine 2-epimerase (non-hydrolysing)